LIGLILRYQKDLEVIIAHANNPTPILYSQAVHVAVWSFLMLGVISGQNVNFSYDDDHQDESNLCIVLLLNFPFQQVIWYSLIFGWLKAAEELRNPFGSPMLSAWNHKHDFCFDMYEELEIEIWKASEFLASQDMIPIEDLLNIKN
jgi:hypothetical protein